jgi:transketolase
MRDAFTRGVVELVEGTDHVTVVTADIGAARFAELGTSHPGRVINLGIREQAMIGVAAGHALEGLLPIVHSYAPFLVERAFEQIKLDLVHQGVAAILVSTGGSYDAAREGRTHQAPGDVALLATLPDVDLHVPGHPEEVLDLLRRSASGRRTTYIRLSEAENERAIPADGRVHAVRTGSHGAATVLAIGPTLDPVLDATSDLDVTVLATSTVRPIDRAGLGKRTGTDLVVVEPFLEGTTLPILARAFAGTETRLSAHGVPAVENRRYGRWDEHRSAYGLDAQGIREHVGLVAFDGAVALRRHSAWIG